MSELIKGHDTPRISTKPLRPLTPDTSLGFDAIEFAEGILGLSLMQWQKNFLIGALELKENGDFRYKTVLLNVARQNGKSFIMIVMALYFMFIKHPGSVVLGTAQDLGTSEKTWKAGVKLVEAIPGIEDYLPKNHVYKQRGAQALILKNESEWQVGSTNGSSGRGNSTRLVLLDELREHEKWDAYEAIVPTTANQPNAMVLGVSNAGSSKSVVLKSLRSKAIASAEDENTSIAIFEWSTPDSFDIDDHEGWAYANPALNQEQSFMTIESLQTFRDTFTDHGWKIEHLCQWVTVEAKGPWDDGVWENQADIHSQFRDDMPVTLSVDVSTGQRMSYIALAGHQVGSDKIHIEIIAMREGSAWVAPWLDKRFDVIGPTHVVLQGPKGTPAVAIADLIEERGIPITWLQGSDVTTATAKFYGAVKAGGIVHRDQQVLTLSAQTTQLLFTKSGTFMFERNKDKNAPVDSEPLIACMQAWYFLTHNPAPKKVSAYERSTQGLMVV